MIRPSIGLRNLGVDRVEYRSRMSQILGRVVARREPNASDRERAANFQRDESFVDCGVGTSIARGRDHYARPKRGPDTQRDDEPPSLVHPHHPQRQPCSRSRPTQGQPGRRGARSSSMVANEQSLPVVHHLPADEAPKLKLVSPAVGTVELTTTAKTWRALDWPLFRPACLGRSLASRGGRHAARGRPSPAAHQAPRAPAGTGLLLQFVDDKLLVKLHNGLLGLWALGRLTVITC